MTSDHPGIVQAIWKPDGSQFATWGNSPYVEIWRDSDGLRLMVLNHVALMDICPGCKFIDPNAFVSNLRWSDDGETITTVAHTHNLDSHVVEQRWSATTGELLYSYVIASKGMHGPRVDMHAVVEEARLTASWTGNRISFLDIELGSATLGQEVAAIDFGDLSIHPYRPVHWRADSGQALFTLIERPDEWCSDCAVYYRLVDIELNSASFGDTLWELEVALGTLDDIWYSAGDLFARIDLRGYIDIWDLDRASARFGTRILRIERGYEFFHNLLFDETNQRVIVVEQNNMALIEGAHPDAGPQCIEEHCEYHIGIWDLDGKSLKFGERLAAVEHLYAYDGYGSRVELNESGTQIHVHGVNLIENEDDLDFEDQLFAYDLLSFAATDARDIVPEVEYGWNLQPVPQADLRHLEDSRTRFAPIALHPDGSKLLTRKFVGEDRIDSKMTTLVIDIETGEQLLPIERPD